MRHLPKESSRESPLGQAVHLDQVVQLDKAVPQGLAVQHEQLQEVQ